MVSALVKPVPPVNPFSRRRPSIRESERQLASERGPSHVTFQENVRVGNLDPPEPEPDVEGERPWAYAEDAEDAEAKW